jgi:hypothetical protein
MAKCLFDSAFSANPKHRYPEFETENGRGMLYEFWMNSYANEVA